LQESGGKFVARLNGTTSNEVQYDGDIYFGIFTLEVSGLKQLSVNGQSYTLPDSVEILLPSDAFGEVRIDSNCEIITNRSSQNRLLDIEVESPLVVVDNPTGTLTLGDRTIKLSEGLGNLSIEASGEYIKVFIETEESRIPFSLTGEGIKNLTVSFISLNLDKPSYVFLEEPETFLHPKMMDVLAKEIVNSGKKHQIFLSTHSLEFVEKLLSYAQKEPVDLKILGFYKLLNGNLDYEIYDKEQAHIIVNELEEDLR
jgi:hypothetical protein